MFAIELAGTDERFAVAEAKTAATDVSLIGEGLATCSSLNSTRFSGLAFTHCASKVIAQTSPTIHDAKTALRDKCVDRDGTVAVRARNIHSTLEIDTQNVEDILGEVLTDAGYEVDLDSPDNELRVLFTQSYENDAGICILGWAENRPTRDFHLRQPSDRPFFQPGSMDPALARAVVNFAGAAPNTTLLDPMCGTGGLLIEAGLLGATALGCDVQWEMTTGARQNLSHYLDSSDFGIFQSDVRALPICEGTIDSIVFDAPYGRQSKITGTTLPRLIESALQESHRLTSHVVMVGDQSWKNIATTVGWTVDEIFERRVHRSLTRYIHILSH
ncbi:MAG: THUMP domain-containing protein [Halobacteriaceae archaeon]